MWQKVTDLLHLLGKSLILIVYLSDCSHHTLTLRILLLYAECPARYACCFHWKNRTQVFTGDISTWVLTDWPIGQLSRSRPPNDFETGQKRLGYLVSLLEIVKLWFQIFIPKMSSFIEIIRFFKRILRICTSYMLWVKSIELIVELSLVSYVFEQFSVIRLKLARKFRRFFRACSWRVQLRFSSSRFCSTVSL